MSKIMLVEDDKSLREIYSIRLVAEGYEVVSAGDGEEALALAVQQKPDLILSDVMMPKISGFDMLDILRSTPETKDIKVIMMTALSSEDQRQRGENLGADKYLVKSQVGIEDVINAVHEVMKDKDATAGPDAPAGAASAPAQAAPVVGGVPAAQPMGAQPATPVQPMGAQPVAPVAPAAPVNPATQPVAAEPVATAAATPAAAPAVPAPQNDTQAQMEAVLNEAGDAPAQAWPGTAGN